MSSLNRKITSNKPKHLLVENELKKLETFDSIYFIGKSHFEEDCGKHYSVFHPIHRCFKIIADVGNDSTFITGNLKDCLKKKLILSHQLIIVLLQK